MKNVSLYAFWIFTFMNDINEKELERGCLKQVDDEGFDEVFGV